MGRGDRASWLATVALALVFASTGCGSSDDEAGSKSPVKVKDSALIYLPSQSGGNFHDAIVLLENRSDEPAVVEAQLSILDSDGELVQSITPNAATLPPRGEGAFTETAVDLPRPVKDGKIEVTLDAKTPGGEPVPVELTNTSASPVSYGGCDASGTIDNGLGSKTENLEIRAVALDGGKIIDGGFTYVDRLFPKQNATFSINLIRDCSKGARVKAFPTSIELGEPVYPE